MMTPLTLLCPTAGLRDTLADTLQSALDQMAPDDRFWLASDGYPRWELQLLWRAWLQKGSQGELITLPGPHKDWGHTPRNLLLNRIYEMTDDKRLQRSHIVYVDDDDILAPNALATIRQAIQETPNGIFVFRMVYPDGRILWQDPVDRIGNISTQMIVHPATRPLGVWHSPYFSDGRFIQETIACNQGVRPVKWLTPVICQIDARYGTPLPESAQ